MKENERCAAVVDAPHSAQPCDERIRHFCVRVLLKQWPDVLPYLNETQIIDFTLMHIRPTN
jgi:hypothetical protein